MSDGKQITPATPPGLIEVIKNEDKGSNERWRALGVLEKMEPEATAATESSGPQLD